MHVVQLDRDFCFCGDLRTSRAQASASKNASLGPAPWAGPDRGRETERRNRAKKITSFMRMELSIEGRMAPASLIL